MAQRLAVSRSPHGLPARLLVPAAFLAVAAGLAALVPMPPQLAVLVSRAAALGLVLAGGVVLFRTLAGRRHADELAFLDSVIEHLPTMVFVKDASELRFLKFNRAAEAMTGRSREQMLGRTVFDLVPAEEATWRTENDRQLLATRTEARTREEQIETVHMGERIMSFRRVPLLDQAGHPRYLLGIGEDVTELRRSEARVVELLERERQHAAHLEEANRELEAFSYSVSHDLRAPLRHIDGFADLLRRHSAANLDARGLQYLDVIASAAKNMGRLIDDLLAFSRMSRADLIESAVDLDALVRELSAAAAAEHPERAIEWRIAPLPEVRGDLAMLRQVFVNLVANAVKYTSTRDRAVIEIGAERANGEILVRVCDNGVGFDMTYVHKLFGVFQRLHRADEFEGTGIGLAHVRRIVARHGGRTWGEGAVDRGATFSIALPDRTAPEHASGERKAA